MTVTSYPKRSLRSRNCSNTHAAPSVVAATWQTRLPAAGQAVIAPSRAALDPISAACRAELAVMRLLGTKSCK